MSVLDSPISTSNDGVTDITGVISSITTSNSPMPVWVNGVDDETDTIDVTWIRHAMAEYFHDDIVVVDSHVKDISNTTRKGDKVRNGATLLLTLTYDPALDHGDDRKEDEGLETTKTVVIKQVPPSSIPLSQKLGLAREAKFYSELAPLVGTIQQTTATKKTGCDNDKSNDQSITKTSSSSSMTQPVPCGLPKVYYSYGNMQDGNKVILMEDLGNDYIDSGILFGPGNPNNWTRDLPTIITQAYNNGPPSPNDSVNGSPTAIPNNKNKNLPPTPFEVANQTFLTIAQIHATFWKDPKLLQVEYQWLRGSSWVLGMDEDSWKASQGLIQDIWTNLLENHAVDTRIQWDPLVRECVGRAMDGISWEAQLERLNNNKNTASHWTLVHGDFWPGNVMISKRDVRDVRIIDWEMVGLGSGPQELGQYVLSNMDPTDRRDCEYTLIQNYYNELIRLGVQDFTWDECWKEYTIGGIERWLWFLVYFCAQQSGPLLQWAQFFHDQINEFIHDHNIRPDDITQPRP